MKLNHSTCTTRWQRRAKKTGAGVGMLALAWLGLVVAGLASGSALGQTLSMSVFMTDSPDPVAVGEKVTYDVTVNAPVGDTLSVTETIPSGASYVESESSCPQNPGTQYAVCNTLFGGTSTLKFVLIPGAAGTLTNEVSAVSEVTSDSASATETTEVVFERASGTVSGGGSLSTDSEGDGATASDPVETTVQHPDGGDIAIHEGSAGGITFLGQRVRITVTPSASAANPLRLTFLIDSSVIPAGESAATIKVHKNGVEVPACTGLPQALPDPCVSARQALADGDASITVLTSSASDWDFAPGNPTAVRLVAFAATRSASGVVLRWRTAAENQTLGFNVYRGGLRINRALIPALGGAGVAGYRFLDRSARPGMVSIYRLQVVAPAGSRAWLGTAIARRKTVSK
jgi:hypothetical protein